MPPTKCNIGPEFLREFEAKARSPLGRVVAEVLKADRETIDAGIFYAWDPLAAAALLRPSIVKTAAMHIEIKRRRARRGTNDGDGRQTQRKSGGGCRRRAFRAMFLESFSK